MAITTEIFDVSVTGAAATSLDSGAFTALTEGDLYLLRVWVTRAAGTTAKIYINTDTTDSNYRRSVYSDGGTAVANDNSPFVTGFAGESFADCYVTVFGGRVFVLGQEVRDSTVRLTFQSTYHSTETSLTRLQLDASTASGLGVGSRMQLLHVSATPTESVAVSGAAVTNLSTGALTGYDTEGDLYLILAGAKHTGGATVSDLTFSNNTTVTRGVNASEDTNNHRVTTDSNEVGIFVAMLGFGANGAGIRTTVREAIVNSSTTRIGWETIRQSDTSLSEIDLTCSTSSGLDVGSLIKMWKLN